MNNIKDLYKQLPDMEYSFDIQQVGEITNKSYSGTFKARIPGNKQKILAERTRAELTGGLEQSMDSAFVQFIYKISYLRATLIEMPKWWVDSVYGFELLDGSVVEKLYEEVTKFENEWMKKVWGDTSKNGAEQQS